MNLLRLEEPWFLLLLLPVLMCLVWPAARGGAAWPGMALGAALRNSRGPLVWRLLLACGLSCLVVAAARPQWGRTITERDQAGRDLVLVIDLSGSMRVDDMVDAGRRSDRLAAVFAAAEDFITRRQDDRIGLVFFATRAVTACPPTYDHETVRQFLDRMEAQQRARWERGDEEGLLGPATNLGLGLATAARALRDRSAKGRAVILVTDGADSRDIPGWIDPLLAARAASAADVRVHGIGIGDPAGTFTQRSIFGQIVQQRVPRHLLPDQSRLEAITSAGGGQAFRAEDPAGLVTVFAAIDRLEPSIASIRTVDDFADRFLWPLLAGVALVLCGLVLEPRLRGAA
jgi:Ca-activated chloride channel homolog